MDWVAAIEKSREALRRVLALLLAMVTSGASSETKSPATGFSNEEAPAAEGALPRRLHRAVLRLLRPAEAALRRLIIVAARDTS